MGSILYHGKVDYIYFFFLYDFYYKDQKNEVYVARLPATPSELINPELTFKYAISLLAYRCANSVTGSGRRQISGVHSIKPSQWSTITATTLTWSGTATWVRMWCSILVSTTRSDCAPRPILTCRGAMRLECMIIRAQGTLTGTSCRLVDWQYEWTNVLVLVAHNSILNCPRTQVEWFTSRTQWSMN